VLNRSLAHDAGVAVGRVATVARRTSAAVWVVVGSAVIGVGILVMALAIKERDDREARAKAAAEQAASAALVQEEAAAAAASAAARQREADIASAKAQSAAMGRARRDTWIRQCMENPKCGKWQRDAIIEGAPAGAERDHANLVRAAADASITARQYGKDGPELSMVPAGLIAGLVARERVGFALFPRMAKTSVAEAKKDPATARGRVIQVSGNVVEIHQSGELSEGALVTGDMDVIRFVTAMSTKNIYERSWASFTGVFIQNFSYVNVGGGETQSVLLSGAFDTPENRAAGVAPAL